ncbi:MAG: head decoration protein [Amphritea sp.]|nr:head decoration protein [Amphritea sp.]
MATETYDYEVWETGSDKHATTTGTVASGQNLAKRTPLGLVAATGKFVEWNPAANDGSEVAVRLTAIAVDATGADAAAPMIKSGTFNPELVNWPGGATDVQKAGAFVGTPISLQLPNG